MESRGKGIGGTSLLNAMINSRANPLDHQHWSELLKDRSFKYENVLYYYKKSQNFTRRSPYSPVDPNYHGYTGPLHTTQTVPPLNISADILLGSKQLGYEITDYNGRQQVGASILQYYIHNGMRDDPGLAFISSANHRPNLKVMVSSYVTKLEISKATKRIEGVIFTNQNKTYIARSKKEVILSAGSISSPQILMLSGIGPKDHLDSLGIPVVENLPVGEKLRDHSITFFVLSSNVSSASQSTEESVRQLLQDGAGPLTKPFPYDTVEWHKITNGLKGNIPDVEMIFTNISGGFLLTRSMGFTNETYNIFQPQVSHPLALIITPCHTQSSGTIRLQSADPFEYPLIDSNILSDESDLEKIYETLQMVLNLTETSAFRNMNISLIPRLFPECNDTEPLSKEFWFCYFRRATVSGSHQISTCLMGTSPETGVVDSESKVFGLRGLRVVDASIIPFTMAYHPAAVCAMLAEKISDQLKRQHLYL